MRRDQFGLGHAMHLREIAGAGLWVVFAKLANPVRG
jgi:hypothetical protein